MTSQTIGSLHIVLIGTDAGLGLLPFGRGPQTGRESGHQRARRSVLGSPSAGHHSALPLVSPCKESKVCVVGWGLGSCLPGRLRPSAPSIPVTHPQARLRGAELHRPFRICRHEQWAMLPVRGRYDGSLERAVSFVLTSENLVNNHDLWRRAWYLGLRLQSLLEQIRLRGGRSP